ncbi:MAG: glycoside hydrolase 100 family protein [Anaerolineaceae bacterium]|nr:glycoside hydrolase 100 family protein [Anaerolineaceae bacterium]
MNDNQSQLIHEARQQALEILHACATPQGFRASADRIGYPQIWGRDSIMTFVGAVASEDADLMAAGRASLETLGEFQSPLGLIPLNVNPDSGFISSENAGAVDSNLYFILGHYLQYQVSRDSAFLKASWPRIERAMTWLEYQDMNECGLLEIPEAGNWMDLLAIRYNTLYDNVLFYAAALAYEELCSCVPADAVRAPGLPHTSAASIHERINLLMWVDRCWVAAHFAERLEKLKAIRLEWFMLYHNIGTISSRPFYLPWVAFREYGDWCDSLGNILSILTGVADGHHAEHILRYMHQVGMAEPYPTKAIYPPIYPGESDWREYYRSRNLNLPNQYHNGGVWPFIGGLHVAALVRRKWTAEAERLLVRLAQADQQGNERNWEFNEWMHGQTGRPMGYARQAWSAAMFLLADTAFQTGKLPLFDDLLAAKPASAVAEEQDEIILHPGGGPE